MAARSDDSEGAKPAGHTPHGWKTTDSGSGAAGGGGVRAKRVRWSDEADEGAGPGPSEGLQAAPARRDAAQRVAGDAGKRRELRSYPLTAGME